MKKKKIKVRKRNGDILSIKTTNPRLVMEIIKLFGNPNHKRRKRRR